MYTVSMTSLSKVCITRQEFLDSILFAGRENGNTKVEDRPTLILPASGGCMVFVVHGSSAQRILVAKSTRVRRGWTAPARISRKLCLLLGSVGGSPCRSNPNR